MLCFNFNLRDFVIQIVNKRLIILENFRNHISVFFLFEAQNKYFFSNQRNRIYFNKQSNNIKC